MMLTEFGIAAIKLTFRQPNFVHKSHKPNTLRDLLMGFSFEVSPTDRQFQNILPKSFKSE